MNEKAIEILEQQCINLELECEELREERDALARNLQLARAQIAAMKADRNYPDLRAVG